MRKTLVLNDGHTDVKRTGGVTPQSVSEMKVWLQEQIKGTVTAHLDCDIVFNGDMLDTFTVTDACVDWWIATLREWLVKSSGGRIWWLRGNHDFSAKGDRLSSSTLIGNVLKKFMPDQFFMPEPELTHLKGKLYGIPHCLNSDLFELEIDKAIDQLRAGDSLFLHCNFDSNFTQHSDHSLNITSAKSQAFRDKGIRLIIAHEHNKRVLHGGLTYITGNQFPTSVIDCLDHNDAKNAHLIDEDDNEIEAIPTCVLDEFYIEVPWKELDKVGDQRIVRISGEVPRNRSSKVVDAIAKYRRRSSAFVVSNNTKLEGTVDVGAIEVSMEAISNFRVQDEILKQLSADERAVIEPIIKEYRNDA